MIGVSECYFGPSFKLVLNAQYDSLSNVWSETALFASILIDATSLATGPIFLFLMKGHKP